jgi:GntR family phosphonate transport system transcriptional regulator
MDDDLMTTPRNSLWKSIADALTEDIAHGRYRVGDKLPTEAELALRFGVNRHTVRRALADLADAGAVHARRGSGVFVAAAPLDYPLGRRVRFSQNLAAIGRIGSNQTTRAETVTASDTEAQALRLPARSLIHIVEGISSADGNPVAMSTSVFPAGPLPDFLTALAQTGSVTAAFETCGVNDYTRASTRLNAQIASPVQAAALRIAQGAALLRSEAVNIDATGQPIEFGITWFAGDRVTLTVQPD